MPGLIICSPQTQINSELIPFTEFSSTWSQSTKNLCMDNNIIVPQLIKADRDRPLDMLECRRFVWEPPIWSDRGNEGVWSNLIQQENSHLYTEDIQIFPWPAFNPTMSPAEHVWMCAGCTSPGMESNSWKPDLDTCAVHEQSVTACTESRSVRRPYLILNILYMHVLQQWNLFKTYLTSLHW